MKLFTLTSIFALAFSNLIGSQYVGFHGGPDYGFRTDQSNSGQKVGFQVGGVYGHDIGSNFRAEAEISYRKAHKRTVYSDKGEDQLASKKYDSRHAWSYMLNVCYDIRQLDIFSIVPYAGIGIGFSDSVQELKVKYDSHSDSEKRRDCDFAWQGIAGITYNLADNIDSRVQYTYHRGQQHTINHSVCAAVIKVF